MRNTVNEDVPSLSLLFFPDSEHINLGNPFPQLDFRTPLSLKLIFLYFPVMRSMTNTHDVGTQHTSPLHLPAICNLESTDAIPILLCSTLRELDDLSLLICSVEKTERVLLTARETVDGCTVRSPAKFHQGQATGSRDIHKSRPLPLLHSGPPWPVTG